MPTIWSPRGDDIVVIIGEAGHLAVRQQRHGTWLMLATTAAGLCTPMADKGTLCPGSVRASHPGQGGRPDVCSQAILVDDCNQWRAVQDVSLQVDSAVRSGEHFRRARRRGECIHGCCAVGESICNHHAIRGGGEGTADGDAAEGWIEGWIGAAAQRGGVRRRCGCRVADSMGSHEESSMPSVMKTWAWRRVAPGRPHPKGNR